MNESDFRLRNPPIVEALVDIDCDMPPNLDLVARENRAREAFKPQYPKGRTAFLEHHRIESKEGGPSTHSTQRAVQALQFLHEDEKQLVQVRSQGFTFNRLAPYTSLDDYLPEIERTWRLFREIALPVQIRVVRLRYVNRIQLPFAAGRVILDDYIRVGPRLPDEDRLIFAGFLNQHAAVERDTGHQVNIVLTAQAQAGDHLPVIFDNCVAAVETREPEDWPWILGKISVLRGLKNRIFRNTLTDKCLNLFQRP